MFTRSAMVVLLAILAEAGCSRKPDYDVILRDGRVCDGTGSQCVQKDVGILGDKIAKIGDLSNSRGKIDLDVGNSMVAPGFINMLSWATESLIVDGKSQSDIRQGVTLEIFGEGSSMGPLTASMKADAVAHMGDIKYNITWSTLGEYLDTMVKRGISPNIASYVGATTVRENVLGDANRAPNAEELGQMRDLVRQAMQEGALGVGSALIYAPGFYAKTDELVALCQEAAKFKGSYISHIRSEGNGVLPAVDELISIARQAHVPAEIYHLKVGGKANWDKLPQVVEKIEAARKEGLKITADMYTYTAGATGLDAVMPPWVQEGGYDAWRKRLMDPAIRARVKREMTTPTNQWENLFLSAGDPKNVLFVGFKSDALKPLTGKTLSDVAAMRGKSPEDTVIDLVVEDGSRVETVYFMISEDNIRKEIQLPWVSLASDAASMAPEGVFLKSSTHPRAYGNFAKFLGQYVFAERLIPLGEGVRRMTGLPAENLRLDHRGLLREGYYADVVVFNRGIQDHATYDKPQQYATGMQQVFVNGVQVLKDGEHTGAKPGRAVRHIF